jgi:hypothetical protein
MDSKPTAFKVQTPQPPTPATLLESRFRILVSRCTLVLIIQLTCLFPTSEYFNERGETQAQEVASEYTRRNSEGVPPVPPIPDSVRAEKQHEDLEPGDRNSTALHSIDALTYIDEDFNYYTSKRQRDSPTDHPTAPLVANAVMPHRQDLGILFSASDLSFSTKISIEFADPYQKKPRGGILGKILDSNTGRYPMEQQIEDKRRGVVRQQRPYVGLYTFLIVLRALSDFS